VLFMSLLTLLLETVVLLPPLVLLENEVLNESGEGFIPMLVCLVSDVRHR
jgi:hypothetical protein